jgi:hypothetical protein
MFNLLIENHGEGYNLLLLYASLLVLIPCVPSLFQDKKHNTLIYRVLTFFFSKSGRVSSNRSSGLVSEVSKLNSGAIILSKIIMNDFIIFELSNKAIIINQKNVFQNIQRGGSFCS